MTWLLGQVWLWMVLAALLGAAVTTALTLTRVKVTTWVEVTEQEQRPAAADASDESPDDAGRAAPAQVEEPDSPFPSLPGADPGARPWEHEELWSRPVQRPEAPSSGGDVLDEWSAAAQSWRQWAQAATAGGGADDESGGSHARRAGAAETARPADPGPPEDPFPPAAADEPAFPDEQLPREPFTEPFPEAPFPEPASSGPIGPDGPGSAFAPGDGSMPPGYPVKGNRSTMEYHPPGTELFASTEAHVWFDSEESAEAAGFTRGSSDD